MDLFKCTMLLPCCLPRKTVLFLRSLNTVELSKLSTLIRFRYDEKCHVPILRQNISDELSSVLGG